MLAYNPQCMHHVFCQVHIYFYIDFYFCLALFHICMYVCFLPRNIYIRKCIFWIETWNKLCVQSMIPFHGLNIFGPFLSFCVCAHSHRPSSCQLDALVLRLCSDLPAVVGVSRSFKERDGLMDLVWKIEVCFSRIRSFLLLKMHRYIYIYI